MHCKHCDYALWNLRDRICPECGNAFLPSDYEFVPNSIRFCCTECGQDYYGVDEKGHLVPTEFDCVRCGAPQRMDDMLVLPTEGVTEEQTRPDPMPWVDGTHAGRPFRAWYATMGMAIGRPRRLMRALPDHASVARAWWFALISNTVFFGIGVGPILLWSLFSAGRLGGGAGLSAILGILFGALILMLAFVLAVTIWGLVAHGLLRLTGPTYGTIGRTYQAICYSSACNFLVAIPLCGFYLFPVSMIWWSVVAGLMLATLQRVHGFRAALAAAMMPVVLSLTVVGLYAFMMYWMFSMVGTARLATAPFFKMQAMTGSLVSYRLDTSADGPTHALRLVAEDYLMVSDEFVGDMTMTSSQQIALPGGEGATLADFDAMSPTERIQAALDAADSLPDGVIAHRLGDFVFTYHGIGTDATDNTLWLVIYWPDPDFNPPLQASEPIMVGQLDGTPLPILMGMFPAALQRQNASRKAIGLPPLPDPATITHANPAGP